MRARRWTIGFVAVAALGAAFLAARGLPRALAGARHAPAAGLTVSVSIDAALGAAPLDGRMLLLLSTDSSQEPRFQIIDAVTTQQAFGIDVNGLAPGQAALFDASVLGYPVASLAEVKPGDYWVQGLLHVYTTYRREDGHVVQLPADRGEGQQWNLAPGNLYSTPRKMHIDPSSPVPVQVTLDRKIPPIPPVPDTKYVKHIRILSDRLTKFWGTPTYLGAVIVLPAGWDTHPKAHYPIAVLHGHFLADEPDLRETPADTTLPMYDLDSIAKYCPNGHEAQLCVRWGYPRYMQEMAYKEYKIWTGKGFPRVIKVNIQHANQYYDDSYAVNSENLGPYGDAIMYELMPYIARTYRGLPGWARATYGGSTGGWEALAAQVFYPDEFNGAYVNCPDPIDFHAYTTIDLYDSPNAFVTAGPWRTTPRPAERDYLGQTRATLEQVNQRELVLGTHSRSGGQWDIWEAVFSPVGADGYPRRIYDKRTGAIDPAVAAYWREHYDLVHIMRRDWPALGPKLQGKLHFAVGLSDNFFLNDAVYLAQDMLSRTKAPHSDATFAYGQRDEHCWSGDPTVPNATSRLTYDTRFIPQMAAHWTKTAPKGGDTKSWKY
ncbi:MAG TPA: hypothetical protein VMT93_11250 [Gemmatimonadaceae bacterium]|nr:hypothetical protein [Gemmatimonadaceae bacterium]